jgi:hypothetical protein
MGKESMRNKIIGIFVCMLLITTILPMTAMAGGEQNPEIKDKTGDMFKHVDIVSVWFHEDDNNPDYLYVSFKVRGLLDRTQMLEAIYFVDWNFQGNTYGADAHVFPTGVSPFTAGKLIVTGHGPSDYASYVLCKSIFDVYHSIMTWIIPKTAIGNPHKGDVLTDPFAMTDLRFPFSSFMPHFDLFKDLAWNAWYRNDYTIQI